jgi:UDP-N-acetyl-2-amino-2-deoxyglucuronate dehydrogenase
MVTETLRKKSAEYLTIKLNKTRGGDPPIFTRPPNGGETEKNMEKLKYALVGCGRIAPNHIAAAIANSAKLDIAAICDLDAGKMEKLKQKFGLENVRCYTDYKQMLETEKPSLTAVATDSGMHAQVALAAIESGSNVIVEKPIAMSLADADKLIAAAKAKHVKLCANHQNRFNSSIRQIRSALEAGRFGRLYHADAHILWRRDENYYADGDWRGKWASDGGTLMNQCIHNIDLLRWMMGDDIDEVTAYTARLAHPYIEAEDLGLAIIKFSNGSFGTVEGTVNVFPKNLEETLYIFGENGTVKAGGSAVNTIDEWSFADNLDDPAEIKKRFGEIPPNIYGFGHTPLYADMISAIENDRAPYVDGEAGRRALELVLAIYLSAARGQPVKLPLNDCSSADFEGRFGPCSARPDNVKRG